MPPGPSELGERLEQATADAPLPDVGCDAELEQHDDPPALGAEDLLPEGPAHHAPALHGDEPVRVRIGEEQVRRR